MSSINWEFTLLGRGQIMKDFELEINEIGHYSLSGDCEE